MCVSYFQAIYHVNKTIPLFTDTVTARIGVFPSPASPRSHEENIWSFVSEKPQRSVNLSVVNMLENFT